MNQFFGLEIHANTLSGMTLVLLLSVLLGGLVGLEREVHGHPAGLRTHILVCLGSTLITLVSVNMGNGSNDRIAAQIVTGIGFLGAGAIIREGANVRGLTTAASVWATAGVGIALGTSPFFGQVAVIAALIVVFTLWVLNKVEDWVNDLTGRPVPIEMTIQNADRASSDLLTRLGTLGIEVRSVQSEPGQKPDTRRVLLRVRLPRHFNRAAFLQEMVSDTSVMDIDMP
jgi:putative Mg2+ transporter-C (MgtC) family protein